MSKHEATEAYYRSVHDAAYANLQVVMDLWDRSGRPIGAVCELNPAAPDTIRMRRFKVIPVAWPGFRWVDLETPQVGGDSLIGVVEYLGSVSKDVAAKFLASWVESSVVRPPSNQPDAWRPNRAPDARNGAAR